MPLVPPLTDLPVEGCILEVRAALADHGHAVLHAPPGAGKTTIVPLRLLDEPWLEDGRIVVLEPRRLAARAAAHRMADLLGEDVGRTVGYRTRDERKVSPATRIEVVTEGILTRRLQHDPSLPGTGLVVFDEVHERNLQTDLALALALDARSVLRPDLRVLAMSATLDTARVADLLGERGEPAPVVASEGRSHPVEIRWRPPDPRDRPAEATAAAVLDALRQDDGDVLVFLDGAAAIRRVASILDRSVPDHVDAHPLFGALTLAEQDRALAPSPPGRRRIVLATDIAETSLTVAGVRIVVDSGQVRSPRYEPRSGLTRLHTGPTSRASAEQRSGRAGRTAPGVAHRLWSEGEHAHRRPFAPPEIETVDLAGLALELAVWGTAAEDLGFLDPPPARALADAHELLVELGALDTARHVTAAGRAMAELPVHPRLARMIIEATELGHGPIACAIGALLEERDVLRGRPEELPAAIVERVRLILDPRATHPAADRSAVQLVRRRAGELRRRMGIAGDAGPDDLAASGPMLALAYPDRLAQARGDGRFRLRTGAAAALGNGDELSGETFLVVADLDVARPAGAGTRRTRPAPGDDDLRIRMAAGLDPADVERAAAGAIAEVTTLVWDADRDDLRQRSERRLGAIVLAARTGRATAGDATAAALVGRVRETRLAALVWHDRDRALQARIGFARAAFGSDWPDVTDDALLASVDDWLAPRLHRATGRADLERIDLGQILRDLVGHHRMPELDRLVPTSVTVASGRSVPVDYTGDQPSIALRPQDLFGTSVHPAVAGGRVPLVVHLLSPAGRPIQVTADLPGFWAGSWSEVRKDMAGRYPKHDWPVDPRGGDALGRARLPPTYLTGREHVRGPNPTPVGSRVTAVNDDEAAGRARWCPTRRRPTAGPHQDPGAPMTEKAAIDIRTATPIDRAAVVQVLSEAFADDPVFSWIYPDAATRYRVLPGFFDLLVGQSVRHGANLVAEDSAGAAVWVPPGEVMVDPADEQAFGTAMVALSPPDVERLSISDELFSAHHPTEAHWYLSLLGVAAAHQGEGVGSALLRAATERCDADAAPAYLEATNQDNRRLYQRHGFVVTDEMVLPDGPSVWAMWREPSA